MPLVPAVIFLLTLTQSLPTEASKCPRMCNCDSTKLTVACTGKNLTEVPPTIEEVRNFNILGKFVIFF